MDKIVMKHGAKRVFGATDATERARIFGNEDPAEVLHAINMKHQKLDTINKEHEAFTAFKFAVEQAVLKRIAEFKATPFADVLVDFPAEDYQDENGENMNHEGRLDEIMEEMQQELADEIADLIFNAE